MTRSWTDETSRQHAQVAGGLADFYRDVTDDDLLSTTDEPDEPRERSRVSLAALPPAERLEVVLWFHDVDWPGRKWGQDEHGNLYVEF